MGTLRKMKRNMKSPSALDPKLIETWNQGFSAGVKQQRESDIENLVKLLDGLGEIHGVGDKTSWKIREHFLQTF